MFISEDGTVHGSINVQRLAEVEPKTDEARAQLEVLKRDQEQAAQDAERYGWRASQGERALGINSTGRDDDVSEDDRAKARDAQQKDAQRKEAEAQERERRRREAEAGQPDQEVAQLQAQAEQAGVQVDKRWGADRLRQEITSAQAKRKS